MIINKCQKCDLCLNNNFVPVKPFESNTNKILILLELPSHADRKKGITLNSISSKLLRTTLAKYNLLNHSYVTNVIKCRPVVKNVTHIHIAKCRPYLLEEIKLYKPHIILLFGKYAIKSIYPHTKGDVKSLNGRYRKIGNTYIIMFHNLNYIKNDKELIKEFDSNIAIVEKLLAKIDPYYKWY